MYNGFPPQALAFFRTLARNNDREWFQPRKEIFEAQIKEPMIALVEALNTELAKFAPGHLNDPKKAIYRIYRDTRFSADKTPYKTHIAAIFPRRGADSKHGGPGFYFSVSHTEVEIAGGVYMPQPEELLAVRTWLAENHESFKKTARSATKLLGKLKGKSLQRVPKGFPAAHPAVDLLKMKQWYYARELDPKLATSERLLPELVKHFRAMAPVIDLLNQSLDVGRRRARPDIISARSDYW